MTLHLAHQNGTIGMFPRASAEALDLLARLLAFNSDAR